MSNTSPSFLVVLYSSSTVQQLGPLFLNLQSTVCNVFNLKKISSHKRLTSEIKIVVVFVLNNYILFVVDGCVINSIILVRKKPS